MLHNVTYDITDGLEEIANNSVDGSKHELLKLLQSIEYSVEIEEDVHEGEVDIVIYRLLVLLILLVIYVI